MKTAASWRAAANVLGIRVEVPFLFLTGGRKYTCAALVMDFGGGRGTLVMEGPSFQTDRAFVADAEAAGYRWSFVNPDLYKVFDEHQFKETLIDWGYTGPPELRPSWLGPFR